MAIRLWLRLVGFKNINLSKLRLIRLQLSGPTYDMHTISQSLQFISLFFPWDCNNLMTLCTASWLKSNSKLILCGLSLTIHLIRGQNIALKTMHDCLVVDYAVLCYLLIEKFKALSLSGELAVDVICKATTCFISAIIKNVIKHQNSIIQVFIRCKIKSLWSYYVFILVIL